MQITPQKYLTLTILTFQNDSEIMPNRLENSVDEINLDDDEGEAAAMEDSDLEEETDEVSR